MYVQCMDTCKMYSNTETCLRNKNQARTEHHSIYGRNSNTNKLTQATTRHRPPESSNKRYHQSINIGLLYNKSNKTRKLSYRETSYKEGQDLGKLSTLWEKLAACEARIEMMGRMMKDSVGFNEVEEFVNKIERKVTEKESNRGGKRRSQKLIKTTMTIKLADERKKHSRLLKEKNTAKRKIIEDNAGDR